MIKFLKNAHNTLRAKSKLYQSWHTKKHSSKIHLSILIIFTAFIALAGAYFLVPQQPEKSRAENAAITIGFPRLGNVWAFGEPSQIPADKIARYDYWVAFSYPWNDDYPYVAAVKNINPNIIVMGSGLGRETAYLRTNYNEGRNIEMRSISTDWMLTQVGSSLESSIINTSSDTQVHVMSTHSSRFNVGEAVIIGGTGDTPANRQTEIAIITAIDSANDILTIKRGEFWQTKAHNSGARIASVVSAYPNAIEMDDTASCLSVNVGHDHAETYNEWNIRRHLDILNKHPWDGIFIDRMEYAYNWWITSGMIRTVDRDRDNVDDQATFWDAHNLGKDTFLNNMKTAAPDKIIFPNGSHGSIHRNSNGTYFENYPTKGMTPSNWKSFFITGNRPGRESYLEHMRYDASPNVTTVKIPGLQTEYQYMRYGLATALLGNGFFFFQDPANHTIINWFDEYSVDSSGNATGDATKKGYLGQPIGDAAKISSLSTPDILSGDGSFDTTTQLNNWTLANSTGYASTKTLDNGTASVDITTAGTIDDRITISHTSPVSSGKKYTVTFRAKADRARNMGVSLHNMSSPYNSWAELGNQSLDTSWKNFELTGTSSGTDALAKLRFRLGTSAGSVWIDDVKVQEGVRGEVWRRDFQNGISIVNAEDTPQTVPLETTFRKINGTQDPTVNDGSLVTSVTLQPRDGIILLRETPVCTRGTGDINGDGHVGISDLSVLMFKWGQEVTGDPADINCSGRVDLSDLSLLMSNWGS